MVCAPQWLAVSIGPSVLIGRHHLIVNRYDFRSLKQFLDDYCSKCTGNTWQEVAEQLGRIGKWEFEDYRSWGCWSRRNTALVDASPVECSQTLTTGC
jgi:hypothetical protein